MLRRQLGGVKRRPELKDSGEVKYSEHAYQEGGANLDVAQEGGGREKGMILAGKKEYSEGKREFKIGPEESATIEFEKRAICTMRCKAGKLQRVNPEQAPQLRPDDKNGEKKNH